MSDWKNFACEMAGFHCAGYTSQCISVQSDIVRGSVKIKRCHFLVFSCRSLRAPKLSCQNIAREFCLLNDFAMLAYLVASEPSYWSRSARVYSYV